jgi:transposase
MEFKQFMGVDVSKETLDITIRDSNSVLLSETIANGKKEINHLFKCLFKKGVKKETLLICLEQTGIYSLLLLSVASDLGCALWVEDAVQIKQVLKVNRSKNDKLDAKQIAEYAFRFQDRAVLWEAERTQIKALRKLISQRRRLITIKKILTQPVNEAKRFESKEIVQLQEKLNKPVLNQIEKSIKDVEARIKDIINSDEQLKHLFVLVTSVDGIGEVVATHMIVHTNEFKRFKDAKKLACHAGVVPFDRTSGSSIRGKSSVSHRANKTLKCVIHMAAVSVTNRKGELQDYYLRKVAEGKNKMSVINAIRNKLVLRIFACVRDQRPYQKILPVTIV